MLRRHVRGRHVLVVRRVQAVAAARAGGGPRLHEHLDRVLEGRRQLLGIETLPVKTAEEGVRFEKRQVGAAGAETVLRVADEELRQQHPARGGHIGRKVEVGVVGVEAQNLPRRDRDGKRGEAKRR